MIYIVSYPRSGNTMTRYLIELMTGKPTCGLIPGDTPNAKDNLQPPLLHKHSNDFCAYKKHDFKNILQSDMVIYVMRDWLEAIIRHNERPRGLTLTSMVGYADSWFSLLNDYDRFTGNKLLFKYEDVMIIASNDSRDIYRNAQSGNDPDFHKKKISDESRTFLTDYVQQKYSYLYKKFIK